MKKRLILCTLTLSALLMCGCTQNMNQGPSNTSPDSGTDSADTEMLSEEEAQQIALTHAKLSEDQVTFIKNNVEREDGREVYDVEFYTQDRKEYDYEIDCYTGDILDYDFDLEQY